MWNVDCLQYFNKKAELTKPAMNVAKSRTKWMLGFLERSENRSFWCLLNICRLCLPVCKIIKMSLCSTHYRSIHVSSAESSCFIASSEQREDEEALWGQTSLRQSCQKNKPKIRTFFAFSRVSNLVGPWQTNPCWQLPMPSIVAPLPYLHCPVSLWLAPVQLAKTQSTKWADKMAQMKQPRLGWEEVRSRVARDCKGQGRLQFQKSPEGGAAQ